MKKLMLIALLSYLPAHAMESTLKKAVIEGDIARVRKFLERGANIHGPYTAEVPDGRSFNGWTLLHFAARSGRNAIIEELLNYGADINAQIQGGSTPLHLAAFNDHDKTVVLLLERGADMNMKNCEDETPYDVAYNGTSTVIKNFRPMTKIKGISTAEGSQ